MRTPKAIALVAAAVFAVAAAAAGTTGAAVAASPRIGTGYYASPNFCSPDWNPPKCINSRNEGTRSGTHIQIWDHSRVGNAGNYFVFVQLYRVNSTWPFGARSADAAYRGFAVGNLEKVTSTGRGSNMCISTRWATHHLDSAKRPYYFPIELSTCSAPGSHDRNWTYLVWIRGKATRMEFVRLSNNKHRIQHVSCIFYSPQRTCENGDGIDADNGRADPQWQAMGFSTTRHQAPVIRPATHGLSYIFGG